MKKFVFTKILYSRNCFYRQKGALKVKLENFSSSDTKVKNINILVAGQVGAGKSSFINSINSAFQGRIVARAMVNSSEGDSHSFTQKVGILFYKKKKKMQSKLFSHCYYLKIFLKIVYKQSFVIKAQRFHYQKWEKGFTLHFQGHHGFRICSTGWVTSR